MPRAAELSNIERDFILQALRENTRLDGRQLEAYRDLDIAFGEEYGTVDIRLGRTRSVCRSDL
jgi:exosome complex component RRP45